MMINGEEGWFSFATAGTRLSVPLPDTGECELVTFPLGGVDFCPTFLAVQAFIGVVVGVAAVGTA